jgi:hypothetical protein
MIAPADLAFAAFTLCNSVRVLGYVPQILRIGQDTEGATAISYTTWSIFAASHFSTVVYAVMTVEDLRMAAIFAANTLCCIVILGLTAWKRAAHGVARPAGGRPVAPRRLPAPGFRFAAVRPRERGVRADARRGVLV